ncbi:hypothetical protein [Duganella sp. Root1480D1]|uniref:hypothetical protein n=1 Tax=Duganella sp. Root1480D1 TaxID=1736471 RepID=UPI00070AD857|nr:hypothetical protein [Duganella sp. Root1480D1]KQZ43541.1 hypothetical protein ASD58_22740 [Duganella sp. Root1480D1]
MKTLFIAFLLFFAHIDAPTAAPSASDGQQDFNWELGTWETKLRRLGKPLSGSQEWLEYTGTTTVTPLMDKRANIVEFDVQGAAGRISGVSLRLYQPASGQWSLHFANLANGSMTEPMQGSFKLGRGTFFGQDMLNGRKILVRFLIIPLSQDLWRFEQAYSADNGKNWEDNWIAVDTRQSVLPSRVR